ncbi:hypothetical protein JTE90_028821 [Oedothorax gibbosus]|uniref:Uncharacterized protein n=1 Tax=Oedothorax gibbosus TaxID=931172 RepID=A0AAV6W044_9ARAC|nr:hypothetical protein JTE90_028821 [Oedothorax gibbosus]
MLRAISQNWLLKPPRKASLLLVEDAFQRSQQRPYVGTYSGVVGSHRRRVERTVERSEERRESQFCSMSRTGNIKKHFGMKAARVTNEEDGFFIPRSGLRGGGWIQLELPLG